MNRRHRQTPFQNKTNFEPYPMLQYVEAVRQYIGRSKRHQYLSPLVKILAKFTIRTYTNAFFASHDYSRRFSGANIRILFNTGAKKDKVLYKNTENQRYKKQKANLRGWQLALIMSMFYGILLLLKPTH